MINYRNGLAGFLCIILFILLTPSPSRAQDFIDKASIQGNFYSEANYYFSDSTIATEKVPEYVRANIYGNIFYRYNKFNAGLRYEAYMPPLLGYDSKYEGQGIAHLFLNYTDSLYEITVGNFYEQFGNGIILRAYEDKNLGIDNAFNGFKMVFRPLNGLTIKGIIGKQRYFWDYSPGTTRGFDAEWNILQTLDSQSATTIIVGGSAVSRYQKDKNPLYNLPENVASFAGRASLYSGGFFLSSEYAWRINDPSATNNMIYKEGQALFVTGSYSTKGLGVLLSGKYIDNMDFRSSREATSNDLTLSYLPPTTRQHTYSLPAMYPYATQPTGEAGALAEINYLVPRKSLIGGKYGTNITLSASIAYSIDKERLNDTTIIGTSGTKGYTAKFGKIGDEKYYHDLSLEVNRKISQKFKIVAGAAHQFYNMDIIQGHPGAESVKAFIAYADFSYRIGDTQNIRIEAQHLSTKQDKGNWAMLLAEYTVAPKWSFSVTDQYNYGNNDSEKRIHYYSLNLGHNQGPHRLAINFGKQREGVICVGGICRRVPSAFAGGITFSTTF